MRKTACRGHMDRLHGHVAWTGHMGRSHALTFGPFPYQYISPNTSATRQNCFTTSLALLGVGVATVNGVQCLVYPRWRPMRGAM